MNIFNDRDKSFRLKNGLLSGFANNIGKDDEVINEYCARLGEYNHNSRVLNRLRRDLLNKGIILGFCSATIISICAFGTPKLLRDSYFSNDYSYGDDVDSGLDEVDSDVDEVDSELDDESLSARNVGVGTDTGYVKFILSYMNPEKVGYTNYMSLQSMTLDNLEKFPDAIIFKGEDLNAGSVSVGNDIEHINSILSYMNPEKVGYTNYMSLQGMTLDNLEEISDMFMFYASLASIRQDLNMLRQDVVEARENLREIREAVADFREAVVDFEVRHFAVVYNIIFLCLFDFLYYLIMRNGSTFFDDMKEYIPDVFEYRDMKKDMLNDKEKLMKSLSEVVNFIKSDERIRNSFNIYYMDFITRYGETDDLRKLYGYINNVKSNEIALNRKKR